MTPHEQPATAMLDGLDFRLPFDWHVHKVWSLDLPVEEAPVSELEWHLDVPAFCSVQDGPADTTPRQVLVRPDEYPIDYRRVLLADTSYPIDTMRRRDRTYILDGYHRLLRAVILEERTVVSIRRVPPTAQHLIEKIGSCATCDEEGAKQIQVRPKSG